MTLRTDDEEAPGFLNQAEDAERYRASLTRTRTCRWCARTLRWAPKAFLCTDVEGGGCDDAGPTYEETIRDGAPT